MVYTVKGIKKNGKKVYIGVFFSLTTAKCAAQQLPKSMKPIISAFPSR